MTTGPYSFHNEYNDTIIHIHHIKGHAGLTLQVSDKQHTETSQDHMFSLNNNKRPKEISMADTRRKMPRYNDVWSYLQITARWTEDIRNETTSGKSRIWWTGLYGSRAALSGSVREI